MIEKVYRCDLCDQTVSLHSDPARRPPRRICFGPQPNGIRFVDLTYEDASDKVLCGRCLNDLKKALAEAP